MIWGCLCSPVVVLEFVSSNFLLTNLEPCFPVEQDLGNLLHKSFWLHCASPRPFCSGSTRGGWQHMLRDGTPCPPRSPGGPAPDVLGAGLETPGSSSLATSGRSRRWEAEALNKVNKNIKSTEKAGEGCPQNQKSALQLATSMVLQL